MFSKMFYVTVVEGDASVSALLQDRGVYTSLNNIETL